MEVIISRDPVARVELIRMATDSEKSCEFCGQKRKTGKLFNYGILQDGLRTRPQWDNHLFCSVTCYRHYHS